jgi:hypothetical protein
MSPRGDHSIRPHDAARPPAPPRPELEFERTEPEVELERTVQPEFARLSGLGTRLGRMLRIGTPAPSSPAPQYGNWVVPYWRSHRQTSDEGPVTWASTEVWVVNLGNKDIDVNVEYHNVFGKLLTEMSTVLKVEPGMINRHFPEPPIDQMMTGWLQLRAKRPFYPDGELTHMHTKDPGGESWLAQALVTRRPLLFYPVYDPRVRPWT